MTTLNDTFTSTGSKFFWHEEAMKNLRNGKGQPIVTHVMLTDVCNHTCAFCSVQHREGDSLPFSAVRAYLATLKQFGLKAVILSGGGNPILYKCKESGADFNDVVDWVHGEGLQIGLITNGMPMKEYSVLGSAPLYHNEAGEVTKTCLGMVKRRSWKTVRPQTLDKLTWVRLSLAGLDHKENEAFVPDTGDTTTLGFSYVAHDVWSAPEDEKHGKVSTEADLLALGVNDISDRTVWRFEDRIPELTKQITRLCLLHYPEYVRLLPNCLQPSLIPERCAQLQEMADRINSSFDIPGYKPAFVQNKPPSAPKACYLGYVHPVLNCDGYVYPCDSCVLNEKAGHQFNHSWRVCHWSEVGKVYSEPVRSLIKNPAEQCPGCVFTKSCGILEEVVLGTSALTPPSQEPTHANFV